jgi:hypothetical protein
MGVAGSDQDSGSEHPNRPSIDLAGAGNSLSVGAFPRISIDMLHRSPLGGSRLTTGWSNVLLSCCMHKLLRNRFYILDFVLLYESLVIID